MVRTLISESGNTSRFQKSRRIFTLLKRTNLPYSLQQYSVENYFFKPVFRKISSFFDVKICKIQFLRTQIAILFSVQFLKKLKLSINLLIYGSGVRFFIDGVIHTELGDAELIERIQQVGNWSVEGKTANDGTTGRTRRCQYRRNSRI